MRVNRIFFYFIFICILFLYGCGNQTVQNTSQTNGNVSKPVQLPQGSFTVDFKSEPAEIKAGEAAKLIFTVKNEKGETIRDLAITHEKPMHLLIVSNDLAEFYHEHPQPQADGSFAVNFAFPSGANYKLYTDFTPPGEEQTVKNFSVKVSGNERAAVELKSDESFEKTVENLRVSMKTADDLVTGKDLMLHFQVFDAKTNQPVVDLEDYLGAKAHFVVISRDLQEFVHAHPVSKDNVKSAEHKHVGESEKMAGAETESIVSAHIKFPKPSVYRLWAQFKRGGKVTTVPFTFEVKQSEGEKRVADVEIPKGAFKIIVSRDGFTPEEVAFQKGQPLKLAFFRSDEENCADEVVFEKLNIRKKLPVGEVVLIDVPTAKAGEINFSCGMSMYKGKIVIE